MSAIQGIEGCGRSLSKANDAHAIAQHPVRPEDSGALSREMQSLSVLHMKCNGCLQNVDFIQRRVNVVTGLVSTADPGEKIVLIAAHSSPMGSINRVSERRTESQTPAMR